MSGYRPDYTREEQKKILAYILENNGSLQLRGIKFWKDMEDSAQFNRTWQSLKEHFRRNMYPNLHLFKLPEDDYTLIKEGYTATSGRKEGKQATSSKLDEAPLTFTDSEEEEEKKKDKKKANKVQEYTDEEQQKIVRYILDNKGQYQLHGIKFWKDMSETDEFQHSWQSLKENFKKSIYRNIDTYNLSIDDLSSIREGFETTRRTITKKTKPSTDENEKDD